jgi:hypothetical protein
MSESDLLGRWLEIQRERDLHFKKRPPGTSSNFSDWENRWKELDGELGAWGLSWKSDEVSTIEHFVGWLRDAIDMIHRLPSKPNWVRASDLDRLSWISRKADEFGITDRPPIPSSGLSLGERASFYDKILIAARKKIADGNPPRPTNPKIVPVPKPQQPYVLSTDGRLVPLTDNDADFWHFEWIKTNASILLHNFDEIAETYNRQQRDQQIIREIDKDLRLIDDRSLDRYHEIRIVLIREVSQYLPTVRIPALKDITKAWRWGNPMPDKAIFAAELETVEHEANLLQVAERKGAAIREKPMPEPNMQSDANDPLVPTAVCSTEGSTQTKKRADEPPKLSPDVADLLDRVREGRDTSPLHKALYGISLVVCVLIVVFWLIGSWQWALFGGITIISAAILWWLLVERSDSQHANIAKWFVVIAFGVVLLLLLAKLASALFAQPGVTNAKVDTPSASIPPVSQPGSSVFCTVSINQREGLREALQVHLNFRNTGEIVQLISATFIPKRIWTINADESQIFRPPLEGQSTKFSAKGGQLSIPLEVAVARESAFPTWFDLGWKPITQGQVHFIFTAVKITYNDDSHEITLPDLILAVDGVSGAVDAGSPYSLDKTNMNSANELRGVASSDKAILMDPEVEKFLKTEP